MLVVLQLILSVEHLVLTLRIFLMLRFVGRDVREESKLKLFGTGLAVAHLSIHPLLLEVLVKVV